MQPGKILCRGATVARLMFLSVVSAVVLMLGFTEG
jgi:hypothetical protein